MHRTGQLDDADVVDDLGEAEARVHRDSTYFEPLHLAWLILLPVVVAQAHGHVPSRLPATGSVHTERYHHHMDRYNSPLTFINEFTIE